MLSASYFFYGSWDWRFLGLLAFTTVVDHTVGGAIHRTEDPKRRRWLLILGVVVSLSVVAFFKYYDFFASSLINLFRPLGIDLPLPILNIILPVGISFFTFQSLSYTIDIYRRKLEPVPLLDFAVFVSFFPHLVAGPIVRGSEFLPQLKERHDPRRVQGAAAFGLIAAGLFKKVVVANTLATSLVDPVFASPQNFSGLEVLDRHLCLRGSDLRRLLRVHRHRHRTGPVAGLPVPSELRSSLYGDIPPGLLAPLAHDPLAVPPRLPLCAPGWQPQRPGRDLSQSHAHHGDRRAVARRRLDLRSLGRPPWSGAIASSGGGEKCEGHSESEASADALVRRLLTFHVVCLGWVLFRSDSVATAGTVLGRLGDWGPAPSVTPAVVVLVAGASGRQYLPPDLRLQAARRPSPSSDRRRWQRSWAGCCSSSMPSDPKVSLHSSTSSSDMTEGSPPQSIAGDQGCRRVA